jgi:hypothetical protein
MQFRSPRGDIPVSNIFGHSVIVGEEWTTVPEVLHRDAMAAGCICEQNVVETKAPVAETAADAPKRVVDEATVIREVLEVMLVRNEDGDFTADETPNAKVVSKLAGMNVRKESVMAVWIAMQNEAKSE